ncbi:M24 family metallopeptidase [Staphylococcus lutrae]|uniref:Peptidase M24 family protein n=1 Tax=Staphylococcus lutrae TaxID=155085 RepID=A0AAC9RU38_9STAP|nr:aminopeptidase P family protein [Staphylococcus lutrae]ARJ51934.1 peptidase M24 family protein [Staphylococcus lutrae]PNZ37801.1 aminopeptidase P family protein [Staphylococcus lutrae]
MKNRLQKIRTLIHDKHLDGIVVLSDFNRRYLSGFTGTSGALLITEDKALLLTDFRYTDQAAQQATEYEVVLQQGDLYTSILQQFTTLQLQDIGFEGHLVAYDAFLKLNQGRHDLISIGQAIETIRETKDESEIKAIQKAADIVDQAYEYILTVVKPGMTEKEVKAHLESKMLHLGADDTSFDTIVASGVRGAMPHGVASDKVIHAGEMVTLDFGAYYQGYCSDITRTFAVGQPSEEMIKIYNIVLESQLAAIEAIRPGMTCREMDRLARDIITEAGYGENFGHSLGHGIGLDIHEQPGLSQKSESVLKVNQCVTIEPGIYVEGLGGVRIEDDILITENGGQRFTNSRKDLIILKEE